MRSAQRRHRLENEAKKNNLFFVIKILFIPAVFFIFFLLLKFTTKYWNGNDKLSYAYRLPNGDAAITIDDPKLSEETTLIIPGDTQVDVAGNYGTFRIKNVWKLSMDERGSGILLPETLTKDFLFPVFLWSDSDISSLKDASFTGILKFIFSPVKTNISLGDRVSIGLFALQAKSINKTEVNLGVSKYLQKTMLNDGQMGYVLNGSVSQRLTVYFADNTIADENLKVGIVDATGAYGVSDNIGQIVQVLGGKVVSIDKKPIPSDSYCLVLGKNSKIVSKIADLFGCQKGTGGNYDIEIDLGTKFAKKF